MQVKATGVTCGKKAKTFHITLSGRLPMLGFTGESVVFCFLEGGGCGTSGGNFVEPPPIKSETVRTFFDMLLRLVDRSYQARGEG